ncbi:MAG: hypothetical protein GC184_00845 [Rhizobiales bacterium]|nr:hypothetical protein [Hyphomicrobiales bacterium]
MNIFAKYANSYTNVFDVAMTGEARREAAARNKSAARRMAGEQAGAARQMTQMTMSDAQRDQRW